MALGLVLCRCRCSLIRTSTSWHWGWKNLITLCLLLVVACKLFFLSLSLSAIVEIWIEASASSSLLRWTCEQLIKLFNFSCHRWQFQIPTAEYFFFKKLFSQVLESNLVSFWVFGEAWTQTEPHHRKSLYWNEIESAMRILLGFHLTNFDILFFYSHFQRRRSDDEMLTSRASTYIQNSKTVSDVSNIFRPDPISFLPSTIN